MPLHLLMWISLTMLPDTGVYGVWYRAMFANPVAVVGSTYVDWSTDAPRITLTVPPEPSWLICASGDGHPTAGPFRVIVCEVVEPRLPCCELEGTGPFGVPSVRTSSAGSTGDAGVVVGGVNETVAEELPAAKVNDAVEILPAKSAPLGASEPDIVIGTVQAPPVPPVRVTVTL